MKKKITKKIPLKHILGSLIVYSVISSGALYSMPGQNKIDTVSLNNTEIEVSPESDLIAIVYKDIDPDVFPFSKGTAREILIKSGISFEKGSYAIFISDEKELIVHNTEQQHKKIKAWLAAQN